MWFRILAISCATILSFGCNRISHDKAGLEPPDIEVDIPGVKENRSLRQIEMSIGGEEVTLEVVVDREERRQGLMYRDSLAPNAGMLFIFPSNLYGPFWMKNTYIPLSIAFISSDSVIVGIIDRMEPLDTVTKYMPDAPYRYAVEMNAGWFKNHGVEVGDTLEIPSVP
ncbi:DUF192 domain-containing protein [candidate division WOR-3 bacterium]|uniref:DUF192 domain-containing protein n=1 Tax=candidate division WOR-3 bacterium TaxID=2052148 RepID=A0A9D5QDG9_UNCW3|nr:DUF192 domain-containing protein [candidate division WOR-3 bacterium]MBD3365624.1 DUF192 domain-containing protein [candidate division WOR-3 bacterium]